MSRFRVVIVGLALLSGACESVESFFSAAPASPSGPQAASQPSSMRVDQACPAWSTLQACTIGNTSYAVARTKVAGKLSLAIDATSRRARVALLGREPKDETVTFTGTLLPAWAKCGDEVFVLASGPKGSTNLQPCAGVPVVDTPPIAACPAWTAGLLRNHERGFSAVGLSEGIEDPSFAVKAAENRARAKLVDAVSVQLTFAGGGISTLSGGTTRDTETMANTTCAGITFAQVVGTATADAPAQGVMAPSEMQAQMEKDLRASLANAAPQVGRPRATELVTKEKLAKYDAYLLATHGAETSYLKAMELINAKCGSNLPLCLQMQKKNKDIKVYRAKAAATKKKLKLGDADASDLHALWKLYLADSKTFSQSYGEATAAIFAAREPMHRKALGSTR